jgi:23S rRNA pseudouridine1911/1915/1917 synthase
VLAHGGVWLDRRRVDDLAQQVGAGAQMVIHRPPSGTYARLTIQPADICYEDRWLLALNKHAGWYTTPTPWDREGNIRVALHRFVAARDGTTPAIHLAHQLDRDTSGILLCCKVRELNRPLQELFDNGQVHKHYLALCTGVPAQDELTIETGHGRGRNGRWRLYRLDEVGTRLPNGSQVKYARTSFRVAQRRAGAALIHAVLHTGRTHQIRLHLAAMGHPLLGDVKYGGALHYQGQTLTRHLLHAVEMHLPRHPVTEEPLTIHAPPPGEFEN